MNVYNYVADMTHKPSQSDVRTKDVPRREGEMIKPYEIMGLSGMERWGLVDRQIWNTLLLNAWSDHLEDPTADFTIPLHELRGSHDSNYRIRETLEKLQTTLVQARMPDGSLRTVQMLGATDISDEDRETGVLRYDFHRKLIPLLRDSEIYARMEIKVISSFTSKYSLALYEIISAKIGLNKKSEDIDLNTLRQWLGVENNKLRKWSSLKNRAIDNAVKEINALSPYSVDIIPVKRGKKIEKVRISWGKKAPFSQEEQEAMKEVNRPREGRKARIRGDVEETVHDVWLTNDQIQRGYEMASSIERIDKYEAYEDWKEQVRKLPEQPQNLVGHFIEFCRKRAKKIKST